MVRFGVSPKSTHDAPDTLSRSSAVSNHPNPIRRYEDAVDADNDHSDVSPTTSRTFREGVTMDEQALMDQLLQQTLARMATRYQNGGGYLPDGHPLPGGDLSQEESSTASGLGPRPPMSKEPSISPSRAPMSPASNDNSSQSNHTAGAETISPVPPPRGVPGQSPRGVTQAAMNNSITIQKRRQILADYNHRSQSHEGSPFSRHMTPQLDDSLDALRRDALTMMQTKSVLKQTEENSAKRHIKRKVTFNLEEENDSGRTSPFSRFSDYSHTYDEDTRQMNKPSVLTEPIKTRFRPNRPQSAKANVAKTHSTRSGSGVAKRPMSAGRLALRSRKTTNIASDNAAIEPPTTKERPPSFRRRRPISDKYSAVTRAGRASSNVSRSSQIDEYLRPHHDKMHQTIETRRSYDSMQSLRSSEESTAPVQFSITQNALLHNVLLATKPRHKPDSSSSKVTLDKLEKNGLSGDDADSSRFMCLSCHDWACNCRHPRTVTRYNVSQESQAFDSVGPITRKKDYVIPKGCTFTSGPDVISDYRRSQKNNTDTLHVHGDECQGHRNAFDSADHDPLMQQKRELQSMQSFLAKKPVSVKRGFRVSGPHWISKGHTQSWPWKGTVCLSISGDQKITASYHHNDVYLAST